ncbi:hypothetical protein EM808_28020 [Niallia taxi]|uniref:Uncharacterized protein n=1 Tax=Niallia taxi TaxID=2499688 RepID=A0A3S2X4N5_9BACI|nr:hypothetical protein EM808_28020 [Niallia taxi]
MQKVELGEVHPELEDKIQLFISAKKLVGLSSITLDNYLMELSMFANLVKKKAEDIATADVQMYLSTLCNANTQRTDESLRLY